MLLPSSRLDNQRCVYTTMGQVLTDRIIETRVKQRKTWKSRTSVLSPFLANGLSHSTAPRRAARRIGRTRANRIASSRFLLGPKHELDRSRKRSQVFACYSLDSASFSRGRGGGGGFTRELRQRWTTGKGWTKIFHRCFLGSCNI